MILIYNESTDPAFNLAMEEYLLTQADEEIMMLWRNNKAVIIGRNQNDIEEINCDFVCDNNITVIRRMTGGGAVFHDLGNINFTFIEKYKEGEFNNYEKFTAPIRDYLKTIGVNATLSGRNDLLVDGMKVSGNAQTVKNGRIMHHGTLLFSANMQSLSGALKPKDIKIESKGIKSVKSRVTNISSHLESDMTSEEFLLSLQSYLQNNVKGIVPYKLKKQDIEAVDKLVFEKYGKWEWNFGQSPKFNYEREQKFDFGIVQVKMSVDAGIVESINIYGDFFGINDISRLEDTIRGIKHQKSEIKKALEEIDISSYIHSMTKDQFIDMLI